MIMVQYLHTYFIFKSLFRPFFRKRKKTVCTNAQNVQDLSITRRIWNAIWPNTRKVLSRRVTISKKRSSFATNAEKSTEITNHGSTTSRATALYINAKL